MTANLPAERKPQFLAGAPVAAIVPQDLEQAYRLSTALAASGMAPRGMDRAEQILVAIMAGAELGLAPFQALQSFAVVNGRPTLWGDGLMAVVRARGVKVKEWIEGEGEALVAHCHVIRPDTGEEIERAYSVADAKKAGLWGKAGPWQQHPKRMLQMRSRAFALRDGCADMLRGVQVREEVDDYQPLRDVTPRPSGLRERLNGPATDEGFNTHHAPADEPVEFAEQAEEIAEAEFSEPAADPEPNLDVNDAAASTEGPEIDDAPGADFDALGWAADTNKALDGFATLAALNAFTDDAENIARFEALAQESAGIARSLEAAINGRRKALASKERG